MRLSSTLTNCILKTSSDEDSTTSLGEVAPVSDCSYCKKFLSYGEMKPSPAQLVFIAPYLLDVVSCEERLLSLCNCPLGTGIL